MKNIYLISIPDEFVNYDCYDAFIIIADSIEELKKIASDNSADEGSQVWLNNSKIQFIGISNIKESKLLLGSFNAG